MKLLHYIKVIHMVFQMAMCVIDGSVKEGGGQILRTAISLSAILCKPVKIVKIRAGRKIPGLRSQHLNGIALVQNITQGSLVGSQEGSTCVTFTPHRLIFADYIADAKTAGSVCLLLQIALPCLLYASRDRELKHSSNQSLVTSTLTLRGGTNADMAPPIDYITLVLIPLLQSTCLACDTPNDCPISAIRVQLIKRGFFPKGQGLVKVLITKSFNRRQKTADHVGLNSRPWCLKPIVLLNKGMITQIEGYIYITGDLPISMAHAMKDTALKCLNNQLSELMCCPPEFNLKNNVNIEIRVETPQTAYGTGWGIILIAKTDTGCIISGDALGKRGVNASSVGEQAGQNLISNLKHGGCVDNYTQDQLLLFMALAEGTSQIKTGPLTLHSESVIYTIEAIEPKIKFEITKQPEDETIVIKCKGLGLPLN